MFQYVFEAIGTHWVIDIYDNNSADFSDSEKSALFAAIKDRIELFEKSYSRFRSDALLAAIAEKSGTYTFPDDAEKLFTVYKNLYDRTDGYFTPLIGGMLVDAGYDKYYSLTQKRTLERPPVWKEVMEYVYPNLIVHVPVRLDFGAAGKGYLIDIIGDLLASKNIQNYCIDAGGDFLYKNTEPIQIGLENPDDTTQVIGVYSLTGGSICGSAGNRRSWGKFTHIMNPKTLESAQNISAVWVVAQEAFIADALTTCLFFVDLETLKNAYEFEYLIVYADRSIKKSSGFAAELF